METKKKIDENDKEWERVSEVKSNIIASQLLLDFVVDVQRIRRLLVFILHLFLFHFLIFFFCALSVDLRDVNNLTGDDIHLIDLQKKNKKTN